MHTGKKQILTLIGSATENSSNLKIVQSIAAHFEHLNFQIIQDLHSFPHFETKRTLNNVPDKIVWLRQQIRDADGILFCTPEYIFSIPSGLKNILEWCVSSVDFSNKPVSIITAAASGEKGHEELRMIMQMLGAFVIDENNVLIKGIKSKFDTTGNLEETTLHQVLNTIKNFDVTIENLSMPDHLIN